MLNMENNHLGIEPFLPSQGDNTINYSKLNEYEEYVRSAPTCGIKFVAKGTEQYVINNKPYAVNENQFLVINKGQNFYCKVRDKELVEGFCLGLEDGLLQKVYRQMSHSEEELLDNPCAGKGDQLEFYETIYYASDNFNKFLSTEIKKIWLQKDTCVFDIYNFYYQAAYHLLLSRRCTHRQIQNIKALKRSTRKEIYSRVSIAKSIMDSDICQQLDMSSLARQCGLSEFHFFRSFKEAFSITPHKYLLEKRMEKSMQLLIEEKSSITEIAYQVGFNDACSFSKCFKKYFSFSPVKARHQK